MDEVAFDPHRDCGLCPRLKSFIDENRSLYPVWHNAPVDTWAPANGDGVVTCLIVGLAPGLRGANRTGRPFTGDWAGDLLYETLLKFGFATGEYEGHAGDTLTLQNTAITNAVRCVPPQNKPIGSEINQCRTFLGNTLSRFNNLKCVVTLGKISHDSTIRALGEKPSQAPFGHGNRAEINRLTVISSYHCSRYNTNTGRLTETMFADIFRTVQTIVS